MSEWIVSDEDLGCDGAYFSYQEIVRCEDCTYWKEATVNSKGFLICPASGMEITETDYCSYGERREDGHD